MSDLHQPPQSLVPETPPWETPSLVPETPPWETPSLVRFDGDMLLQLNVTNPNKKQSVKLENLSVELWFAETKIATQGILPFSLRNGKTRLELIRLVSDSIVLPVNHMVELKRQVASNEIDYEVRSTSKVKAVLGIIHYSYWLKGSCRLQLTSPPAGSLLSRNCTTKRW
ncbi:unnamed protein product [Arabidopsis halleri]